VPDRLPQREQAGAKELLRDVAYAPSRVEAVKARETFSKAVDVLEDDWDRMVAFHDFPEAHWKHLRTTNVVDEGRRFVDGKPAPSQQWKVAA
jgi:transposase-like protein